MRADARAIRKLTPKSILRALPWFNAARLGRNRYAANLINTIANWQINHKFQLSPGPDSAISAHAHLRLHPSVRPVRRQPQRGAASISCHVASVFPDAETITHDPASAASRADAPAHSWRCSAFASQARMLAMRVDFADTLLCKVRRRDIPSSRVS